jgi:predicted aspartyl protease
MSKIQHFAFKTEYPGLAIKLLTEAEIFVVSGTAQKSMKVRALWDTGAEGSVIVPALVRSLNLIPINRVRVNGVNASSLADVVKIDVGLPNKVMVKDVTASVCSLVKDVDLLIGMNIILLGDFSISNGEGKTLFTFAIPPFENKTDHYEKALAVNKRNR